MVYVNGKDSLVSELWAQGPSPSFTALPCCAWQSPALTTYASFFSSDWGHFDEGNFDRSPCMSEPLPCYGWMALPTIA